MALWQEDVRRQIQKAKTATHRSKDGKVIVNDPSKFKGLPLSTQDNVNKIVEAECKARFIEACNATAMPYETVSQMRERSARIGPTILNSMTGNKALITSVQDSFGYREMGGGFGAGQGGIANMAWMTGVNGQDPALNNRVRPNLYISPAEAMSIYTQKGLPETIINKKAKSFLLNGLEIKNSKLNNSQLERVKENMVKTGFAKAVSEGLRDALIYSGSLVFPHFKKDTPLSYTLPVGQLAKWGVIKKDCIERWTVLDRWQTVHYPQYNPTAADFLKPEHFYIPFLGVDMHSSRAARIVPSPQPGYWGTMATVGWGVSDIVGWLEAVCNYENVLAALPTMIQQMSLLVRSFNVDGPLAMEGALLMDQIADKDTMRVREASVLNPINMDIIGDLKAVERNFGQVPELTRLIRQDVAAKAGFLEDGLFSSEKKGMGGGDKGGQKWERQQETNLMVYSEVQKQAKPLAMLQIINALGTDRDIIKALPYTELAFGDQKIVSVEDKAEVMKAGSQGLFDISAGGIPLPLAAAMIAEMSGGLYTFTEETRKELEERQKIIDEREKEKHDAEIKAMLAPPAPLGGGAKKPSSGDKGSGHSYGSRAAAAQGKASPGDVKKQKSMTKVSAPGVGSRKQGLQKAESKKRTA